MKNATKRLGLTVVVMGLLAGSAGQARAGTVLTINKTYDLATLPIFGASGSGQSLFDQSFSPIYSISVGDEVHLNFTFTGGDIRISQNNSDVSRLTGWLFNPGPNIGWFTISNASMQLEGFSGSAGLSSLFHLASQTEGVVHLGMTVDNVMSGSSYIQFSGISTTFTVDSLQASPGNFGGPLLALVAQTIEFVDNTPTLATPEPSTMVLVATALPMGLGLAWKRRRKAVAA